MKTYRLHLIRTASTFQEPLRRYVGQSDPPLCGAGRAELLALQETLLYPQVGAVFTSPLQRCTETADLLYPDIWTQELDELMDMNLGVFEGFSFQELRSDPDFAAWLDNSSENPPPGGETPEAFAGRILQAVDNMLRQMMKLSITDAAVITHCGVIMTLLAAIGLPQRPLPDWACDNGSGFTLLLQADLWMRDQKGEVIGLLPYSEPEEEWDGSWEDEEE